MKGAVVAVVLGALGLAATRARAGEPFLPYFECLGATLDEWLSRFEDSGGRSSQALWCVFYRDDGSERVREALRRWHRESVDERVRKEVLTILTHWGEAVEEAPALEDAALPVPGPLQYALATRPFAPPFAPLEGDAVGLRAALTGSDRIARARAALTLMRSPEDVSAVIRTLVLALREETRGTWRGRVVPSSEPWVNAPELTGHALEWCVEYAGDAADAALAAIIEDRGVDDELRLFILRQVPFSRHASAGVVGDALLGVVEADGGKMGRNALARLLQMASPQRSGDRDDRPHVSNWFLFSDRAQQPLADPVLEAVLGRAIGARLRVELGREELSAEFVDEALAIARRSARVREAVLPVLAPALEREGAPRDAILYALVSLGEHGAAVRNADVRRLDSMQRPSSEDLQVVPCLAKHDAETVAALARLAARLDHRRLLAHPLLIGGLLHPEGPTLGREFLAECDVDGGYTWTLLYDLGLRGEPALQDGDAPLARLMKLAITVRTSRERGVAAERETAALLDAMRACVDGQGYGARWHDVHGEAFRVVGELGIATPESLNWSLEYLRTSLGVHLGAAAEMLTHFRLDRRQQALLCQLRDAFGSIRPYLEVLACQGASSLERVAEIRALFAHPLRDARTLAPRIDLDVLDAVLRITRPTVRERAWLAAAIEGGVCSDRARALAIVGARGVDTPEIRAAVERAASDVDSKVRAAAERVWAAFPK